MKNIILLSILCYISFSMIPNCAYESNSKCIACYLGFKLQQNKCDNCIQGYVMNIVDGSCVQKQITNYMPPKIIPTTTSMSTDNNNINKTPTSTTSTTTTSMNQPQPSQTITFDISNSGLMYFLHLFGLGSRVPINCQIFTTDFICKECIQGYILIANNDCLKYTVITNNNNVNTNINNNNNVNTNTNTDINNGATSSLSTSTSSKTDSSNSLSSSSSSSLSISSQQKWSDPYCQIGSSKGCIQCYFRYYYNQSMKKCVEVNTNCLTWNNLGHCQSCYPGYKVTMNNCVVNDANTGTTTTGTIIGNNTITGTTSTESSTISSLTISTSSSSTSTNGVNKIYTDLNCQQATSTGCNKCYFGYYFNKLKNQCTQVNPDCKTWNNQGHCQTCYQGYQVVGINCLIIKLNTGSINLNINNNANTNTGSISSSTSTSTSTSQLLSPSTSSSTPTSTDINCKQPNILNLSQCLQCYFSFYFSSEVKKCIPVNPLCKTWNNQGNCLTCYEGYSLNNKLCIIDPAYQVQINPQTIFNGHSNSGSQSSSLQSSLSSSSSSSSSSSTSSTSSTSPLPSSTDIPSILDPLCSSYKNQKCIKCATRTYYNEITSKCQLIDGNCKRFIQTNGECIECYDGYVLSESNNKVCKLGSNTNMGSSVISSSSNLINTINNINTNTNTNTNTIQNVQILPSSSSSTSILTTTTSTVSQYCKSSDINGNCIQCVFRHVLLNKKCIKVNDLCKTWNQLNAQCKTCYPGYQLTNNSECVLAK